MFYTLSDVNYKIKRIRKNHPHLMRGVKDKKKFTGEISVCKNVS